MLWLVVLLAVVVIGCGDLAQWNARMHGVHQAVLVCAPGLVEVNGRCIKLEK